MSERIRVTTPNGLNLRDSPRDGAVLQVIPNNTEIEVLGRETWLRVNCGGIVGFVSAEYVEPEIPTTDAPDAAATIIQVKHPVLIGEPLRADVSFEGSVTRLADLARELDLSIFVTSSFREPYKPIQNAIVDPATFSNHHVGHAFDMNLSFQGRLFGSTDFGSLSTVPVQIKTFLTKCIQDADLTWGGAFGVPDVVHIDDRLNISQPTLFKLKLASLWGS